MLDDTDLLVLTMNTYPALLRRPPTVVVSSVIREFEGSGISGIAFSRVPLSHKPVVDDPIQYCALQHNHKYGLYIMYRSGYDQLAYRKCEPLGYVSV